MSAHPIRAARRLASSDYGSVSRLRQPRWTARRCDDERGTGRRHAGRDLSDA
jgi:hypothetical protein